MRHLFLSFTPGNFMGSGHTRVIALPNGKPLPPLPPDGITSQDVLARLPVVAVIDEPNAFPGAQRTTYAFERLFVQRNLYRIPLQVVAREHLGGSLNALWGHARTLLSTTRRASEF